MRLSSSLSVETHAAYHFFAGVTARGLFCYTRAPCPCVSLCYQPANDPHISRYVFVKFDIISVDSGNTSPAL